MKNDIIIHGQFKDDIDYKKLIEIQANTPVPFEKGKLNKKEEKKLTLSPKKVRKNK